MKNFLIITAFAVFLTACGGGGTNTTTVKTNSATTNSNKESNSSSPAKNDPEKKFDPAKINEGSEKIFPDPNAKLENGKIESNSYFDITLPAGWKKTKSDFAGDFVPKKDDANGLVEVVFDDTPMNVFSDDREKMEASKSPLTMLEYYAGRAKSAKDKGEAEMFGSFGIGLNADKQIIPIMGVATFKSGPAAADKGKECSTKDGYRNGCGMYEWYGLDGKNDREWNLRIFFKDGAYEKNKPTIDAVIQSIKLK